MNWVLDADFRDYFSSLDHRWLERFVEHRIADKRVLRLIRKWLSGGVIENRSWTACEEGVPQGGFSFTAPGEHLLALRLRLVDLPMEATARARRHGHHALR